VSELVQRSGIDIRGALEPSRIADLPPRDVLLVTDFDGTLSPVVSNPAQAHIHAASEAALRRLTRSLGHVAVLSSRSRADLETRVTIEGVELIGDSGLGDMTSDERRRLEMFNVEAGRVLADVPGVWIETKPAGTAIHHRHAQLHPAEILHRIGAAVRETGLHVHVGRRVIEVVPRERPKGDALAGLIVRVGPAGVICVGDDENDRPMFDYVNALARPHLTVGVASDEARADLFADCDLVVSGPDEVAELLTSLADWADGAG
jgi:trehalose 6-phosphate phosphatase